MDKYWILYNIACTLIAYRYLGLAGGLGWVLGGFIYEFFLKGVL